MKVQACLFLREQQNVVLKSQLKWEEGIAFVDHEGFSSGSVAFIVDKDGHKLTSVHRFRLKEGPLCYIDTQYPQAE